MSKHFGAESTTDEVLEGVDLSGKRVLVTGVSAGLGVETSRYEIRAPIYGSGGAAAATAIHAWVGDDEVDNISVVRFDERGLIRSYVTYWGPGDRRKSESIPR